MDSQSSPPAPTEVPTDPLEKLIWISKRINYPISNLADLLGVSRPTIYSWLRGECRPRPNAIKRMYRVLALLRPFEKFIGCVNDGPA